ncbi:hypothetical protein COS86_07185, partial [Candidatus Bathyarchaeota archaeon CG07_land_8_20_14_0_80_47_9]
IVICLGMAKHRLEGATQLYHTQKRNLGTHMRALINIHRKTELMLCELDTFGLELGKKNRAKRKRT